jgi:sulfate transport system ATP-binding protein
MRIELDGITKSYGSTPVLTDVSIRIDDGELVALLGPSGSGKTTLLRVIAGLETLDAGTLRFADEDVTAVPVQRRGIGMVFQHYALFRHMTVADNIAYGLRVRPRRTRPPAAEIARRVATLLELVQLGGLGARYPAQLSGGQRQRVALARALATEPRALLLDEPFGALDAQVRHELRRWLVDIHRRTGQTTLFVTHDQDEALALADRIAVLNAGRLVQAGSASALLDDPADEFVARFIGGGIVLPASVLGGFVRIGTQACPRIRTDLPDGAARVLLRPHQIIPTTAGGGDFDGVVDDVRRHAAGWQLAVQVPGTTSVVTVNLPAARALPARGDLVGLRLEAWRLYAG